ncbi:EVE domain-containing protein [Shewanella sp. NIFS-20-20]|uniref:EVE domain-containing protein n=1 Tax=Shewanella sp. NIFS-20-20 TaxID=2853806 RepID=UPI001C487645|nr:EVE domain-containing protein [Shewanella sp. NIFS-20-20]MBV7314316.1 EVE domain-containing protein [Shewanella sp. NIFS-20-20]
MQYWLFKSEPDEFSIDDLAKLAPNVEPWSGIRNYQARNFIRDNIVLGDGILFYHSSCKQPGIVGLAEVASDPYPDPSQFDRQSPYYDAKSSHEQPKWLMVDIKFVERWHHTLSLSTLKTLPQVADLALLKSPRLSIQPVSAHYWQLLLNLGR